MNHPRVFRGILAIVASIVLFSSVPARAQQTGRLDCTVLDEANTPIPDAQITLDFVGDYQIRFTTKTNARGEFSRSGLNPGNWRVTGVKGDLKGTYLARVTITDPAVVKLVLRTAKANEKVSEASKLSADEVAKRNKQQKELEDTFNAAKTALDAGNYDDALVKLNTMVEQSPKCATCYALIGETYVRKKDSANAETAFKKSIDADPSVPDVYVALAGVYVDEKKLDDAAKMNQKANELSAAAGGGGNATALYNQGVILWNQGKGEEALPLFQKVLTVDATMADANYMIGMIYVGMDKKPEAIKALTDYLKAAPTGANAATAKAVLDSIK